jgi:hypothetical protein
VTALTPQDVIPEDAVALRRAHELLNQPSLAIRLANKLGRPVEGLVKYLPEGASTAVNAAVRQALDRALDAAVRTLGQERTARESLHRALCGGTGAISGFFGLPALAVELPVSTTLMLRSVAEIAREEGEDLAAAEARLACLEVFALGGASSSDDAAETAYFAVRAGLAQAIREAAQHIAERGITAKGAPAVMRLVGQIASRFGIVVSEKAALQAAPVIGAAGGAAVNVIFTEHFQRMARGHFIIRRLERKYGKESVRRWYEELTKA